jgi:hypothetical protein
VSVDPAVVAARVRRLDAPARAALLADCLAARGETVARDGRVARVRRPDGEHTVAVAGGSRWPFGSDPDADRTLDAAGLRDLLLYGLARDDADRLAATHLGAPLADLRPPLSRRLAAAGGTVVPAAVGLVAVAVVVVAVAGAGVGTAPAGEKPAAKPDPTPAPSRVPVDGGAGTPLGGPAPVEASQVPGLGVGGVRDLGTLAAAHERARPASYGAVVRARRTASDYDVTKRTVELRATADRWSAVTVVRRDDAPPRTTAVYAAGGERWEATFGENESDPTVRRLGPNETGAVGVDPAALGAAGVRAALATPETRVEGPVRYEGRPAWRVVGAGVPPNRTAAVETYRVEAVVRPDGFVVRLDARYTLVGPRQSERAFSWRYVEADPTVPQPSWHPDAGDD